MGKDNVGAKNVSPIQDGAKDISPIQDGAKDISPIQEGAKDISPIQEGAKDISPVHQDVIPALIEAKDETGTIWEVVLTKAGRSANNNEYPPEVLEKAASLFEGVRALSRSDEDHLKDRDKTVKNIVGWFEKVRFSRGALIAEFHVSEAAAWLKTMLRDAWSQGKKDLVGFSIVAEGRGKIRKTPSGFVRTVTSIDWVSSVDVVVNPAAGGRLIKLIAAEDKNQTLTEEINRMEKLLKLLETKAPEVYANIDPEKITEEEVKKLLAEAEANHQPVGAVREPPVQQPAAPATDHTALIEAKEKEADEALQRIKVHECRLALKETLADSGLPELSRTRISKRFEGQVFNPAALETEINGEKDFLAKITESGRITGLGTTRVDVGPGEKAKTLRALDGFFANQDLKEGDVVVPRFRSFREAYIVITGDANISGELREAVNLHKFTEALTSSSWAQVLGDSITRRMITEYRTPGLSDWRKIVSDITSINDFRTNRRMRFGGYGAIPAVAESGTYLELSSPGDEEATFAVSKYGGLETVTLEMIANDDQGSIRRIPMKLGRSAAIGLYRFVFDFIKDNNNVTYEAVALFHGDHSNLGSAALSATSLLAAKIVMGDQAGYGEAQNIMGLMPKYLLVPSELQDIAFRLTTAQKAVASAEGTPRYTDVEPNIHSTYGLEVVLVPYWTDANDWTLVCNLGDCPTLEIGFFQGREEPELFVQDQPTVGSIFTADKITYKIRHIYGGTVLDHRGMYKAVV